MLRHRAARAAAVQAHLLVPARSADDVLYRDELGMLEPREGLRIAHTYTREAPPGWTGFSRRVDAAILVDVSPGPDARCFVCGPTTVRRGRQRPARRGRHDPRDVRAERFGPTGG